MLRLLALLLLPLRSLLSPPAPGRFGELTRLFRAAFPDASPERWEAHCAQLAEAAYWEGERRGYDRMRGLSRGELDERHGWTARAPGGIALTAEQIEIVRRLLAEGREVRVVAAEDPPL